MALRDPMPFEEERALFLHELGITLAVWATAEASLFRLVLECFPEEARPATAMGYANVIGLNAKLQFADGAMRRRHAGHLEIKENWGLLLDDIKRESGKRNNLAHWQTIPYPASQIEGRRMALVPWKGKKGQPEDRPPEEAICLMEVVTYRTSFMALAIRLENFRHRILGQQETFPKSAEQVGNPPTIRSLRLRIHEALGHPHESSREKRRKVDEANAAASYDIPLPNGDANGAQIETPNGRTAGEHSAAATPEQAAETAQPGSASTETKNGEAP
jgi:hypothetical protein